MHVLPKLAYAYNALEPFIDEQTMILHHDKHHQTYVDKLNEAVKGSAVESWPVEKLMADLDHVPESIRTAVRNHGGGVFNHNFFWTILKKDVPISSGIATAIDKDFGSFEKFKEQFTAAVLGQFGSGWAWLVLTKGKLEIVKTSNQDCPLSDGKKPLLCIDVWEHSYYLRYFNRRADYVDAWWNVVNWEQVEKNYELALKR
ncbi:MAG: superoxide dismutase [archaeon]